MMYFVILPFGKSGVCHLTNIDESDRKLASTPTGADGTANQIR